MIPFLYIFRKYHLKSLFRVYWNSARYVSRFHPSSSVLQIFHKTYKSSLSALEGSLIRASVSTYVSQFLHYILCCSVLLLDLQSNCKLYWFVYFQRFWCIMFNYKHIMQWHEEKRSKESESESNSLFGDEYIKCKLDQGIERIWQVRKLLTQCQKRGKIIHKKHQDFVLWFLIVFS